MGLIENLKGILSKSRAEYNADVYPLTVEVTKVGISERMEGLFTVTINLRCIAWGNEVINQNFTENYRPGDSIEHVMGKISEKMQDVINKYKNEQVIDTTLDWNIAIAELQKHLEEEN